MRLLHTEKLELTSFLGEERPKYAILSHTWGDPEDEILLGDVQSGRSRLLACGKPGLPKLLKAAEVARDSGLEYIWIDTCCIDKSSSAELSEAINSMFAWYASSTVCYAYISDFESTDPDLLSNSNRWFTRGWTLQELIAPPVVEFYNKDWVSFGNRESLRSELSSITGIEALVFVWHLPSQCSLALSEEESGCDLCHVDLAEMLDSFSVATRMSWAARRRTTRPEDAAYSLLGLFHVNMPLLYGEGQNAFQRLQHEIIRKSTDQSILTFTVKRDHLMSARFRLGNPLHFLFAGSPSWFEPGLQPPLTDKNFRPGTPILLLSSGIQLEVHIAPCTSHPHFSIAVLSCSSKADALSSPALILWEVSRSTTIRSFKRMWIVPREECPEALVFHVNAGTGIVRGQSLSGEWKMQVKLLLPPHPGLWLVDCKHVR